jgi:PPM family protein phosphatase
LRFDSASESNSIQPGHEDNQDSLLADPANLIFAVADGVGGYRGGKEASQLAIETLSENAASIFDEATMKRALEEMHDAVRRRARTLYYINMGTTAAIVKILSGRSGTTKIVTGNVGDSPILLFPASAENDPQSFSYIFTDDSHRDTNPSSMFGITQYLGVGEIEIDYHVRTLECSPEDMILICSDGVTDNLLNPGLRGGMRLPEITRRFRSAKKIVEEALKARVKPDDMTVVLITI